MEEEKKLPTTHLIVPIENLKVLSEYLKQLDITYSQGTGIINLIYKDSQNIHKKIEEMKDHPQKPTQPDPDNESDA